MNSITVDIYEGDALVVRHVFFGRTEAEAKAIYQAHLEADAFLRACVQGGCYKGSVPCRAFLVAEATLALTPQS